MVDLGCRAGRLEPVRAAHASRPKSAGTGGAAAGALNGTIIALDMLRFEPIEGVQFIQGDFREEAVAGRSWRQRWPGRAVDVVVSDMAPNLSGIEASDSARMAHLVELAVEFAGRTCSATAPWCAKVFHGSGYSQLVELFKDRPSGSSSRSSPRPRATSRRKPFWSGIGLKRADAWQSTNAQLAERKLHLRQPDGDPCRGQIAALRCELESAADAVECSASGRSGRARCRRWHKEPR